MKINIKDIHKHAKRLWLWLLRNDVVIFLLFVGIVTIFWWGRTMSSPRDINLQVSLSYSGISEQVVFAKPLPNTITLIVRDNGQELRKISQQDLHTTINLTPYLSSENGIINLSADVLRPRLQDLLPGSTTIQKINPEAIESAYQIQQTKIVPVHIQSLVNAAPQYLLIGEGKVTPTHVQIFGNQNDIDSIQYILTDSIRVIDLRDAISIEAPLLIPTGIRVQPQAVHVEWKAEQFTEKSFNLPVQTMGLPEGKQLRLFPQFVNVTIRVGISNFASVQASDFQAICHYPTAHTYTLPIEVITTNPNISNIRVSPSSVEYIIEIKE